ncbi:MAG: DUF4956 domain-containing protein [Kiritimatiellae bacterium]|nr:DUF4956 domain-containing protein [Kiritimatiellia bacterium]
MQTQWLTTWGLGGRKMQEAGFWPLLLAVAVSLLCAMFISWIYARFFKSRAAGSMVHRAFPLLGVSVTSIFITIQFSLPLSLGLLGALSIVRFRTPVKEPEEIGFIMLVIATSLCCATFNVYFLSIILIVAVAGILAQRALQRWIGAPTVTGLLTVVLPTSRHRTQGRAITEAVARAFQGSRLDSLSEHGEETHLAYRVQGASGDPMALLGELATVAPEARASFFSNPDAET